MILCFEQRAGRLGTGLISTYGNPVPLAERAAVATKKTKTTTSNKRAAGKAAGTREKRARKSDARRATVGKKAAKKTRKAGTKAPGRSTRARAASQTAKRTARKTVHKTITRAPARAAVAPSGETRTEIAGPPARATCATTLRKRDLEQFRELLLAKRAQLVGDVSTLQEQALSANRQDAAGDLSSMPIHMADLGSDNYEKEFTLGLIESERTLLREIDEALARIDAGTYGVCQATGRPIGKARLKAQPWVKYCYEYVLAQESGRRTSGL
jgi:DnaK suppressor protein